MPIPAAHINEFNSNQQVVWIAKNYTGSGSTGLLRDNFSDDEIVFFHSKQPGFRENYPGTYNSILISNSDRKLIHFEKSFKNQFELLSAYFQNLNFQEANEKLSSSLISLLNINPDVISMELTRDKSIFYTLKKQDYTFFIQHFLNEIEDDEDEAILTVFKDDNKLPSYAGSLLQTISELNTLLEPSNTSKLELELNELSN